MLQAAAGANNLGNSDHGAIVGELPVKSSMEEQAQEQTHSVFSSKASNDYHFKTGQCEIPSGHGTSGVAVTHWRSTQFGRESSGPPALPICKVAKVRPGTRQRLLGSGNEFKMIVCS
jgi:hypothetical protein